MPRLVLEADVDEVARLEHLLGGLREARLVPVHRLERGEARQEAGEREEQERCDRSRVACRDEAEEPARGPPRQRRRCPRTALGERRHSRGPGPGPVALVALQPELAEPPLPARREGLVGRREQVRLVEGAGLELDLGVARVPVQDL